MNHVFLCKTDAMLNYVWIFLVLAAVLIGGIRFQFKEITDGMIKAAETAVTISIGLAGVMAMWLGIMRVAEKAGIVSAASRFLKPVLKWLFPEVPDGHPAMCSILMNISANMLGLSNAATPLGLRAMKDLQSLNPVPSVATNAMCMFLAINTSSVQLIPMTAVAILASAGSMNPTAIVGTSLVATVFSTIAGIASAKIMERWKVFRVQLPSPGTQHHDEYRGDSPLSGKTVNSENKSLFIDNYSQVNLSGEQIKPLSSRSKIVVFLFGTFFFIIFIIMVFSTRQGSGGLSKLRDFFVRAVESLSILAIPFLFSFFALVAALRRVRVYEEFITGAKEGFNVAVRIIPYLVAILVSVAMFKGAGGIELISKLLGPLLSMAGFPPELLPMALMRPLSGSATLGIFTDLVKQFGPDSLIARIAGTIYGSTETTFYVIAVYFGSVNIRRTRHAIAAGLIADLAGVVAAVTVCKFVFG